MATTKNDLRAWFTAGVEKGATHLIVVCDTFDHDDYPVYVMPGEEVRDIENKNNQNMQKVMEVYNLKMDREKQMAETRAFNY